MSRPRFSLRWLLTVVTVAAIGSAALATPTDWWAAGVFSGTLILLAVALLGAVSRRKGQRSAALGFALCGGGYLALILAPGAETNIVPHLVTTMALSEAEAKWHSSANVFVGPPRNGSQLVTYRLNGSTSTSFAVTGQLLGLGTGSWQISPFQRIGHCLWALLFAAIGSLIARLLYVGGESKSESNAASAEQSTSAPSRSF